MSSLLHAFMAESNRIEGIFETTEEQVEATRKFLALPVLGVEYVAHLVNVYQPGAVLRTKEGMNVRVGNHIAPPGGPHIFGQLDRLLGNLVKGDTAANAWMAHLEYETLHPFTDGKPTLENCEVLCGCCHREKTAQEDVPRMAKADRARRKIMDGEKRKSRPIPGSKASGWRKRMDGTVERR